MHFVYERVGDDRDCQRECASNHQTFAAFMTVGQWPRRKGRLPRRWRG